jgi:hypothetical protein
MSFLCQPYVTPFVIDVTKSAGLILDLQKAGKVGLYRAWWNEKKRCPQRFSLRAKTGSWQSPASPL